MRISLEHLPEHKQDELRNVTEIIREQADPGMIILFGSHARGDWVEELAEDGVNYQYQSDFDILAIVETVNEARKIERNGELKKKLHYIINTPVNLIVHDVAFVNKRLKKAQYFFSEIKNQGVMLFDSGQFELAEAKELHSHEYKKLAQEDFEGWFSNAITFQKQFKYAFTDGDFNIAAFLLHQTTEFLYNTFLLVFTRFIPNTHDLRKLSKRVNGIEPKFLAVFPQSTEEEKQCFELLCEAYVRGRYKPSYSITKEQLSWLAERVQYLQRLTEELCKEKIASIESGSNE